MKRKSTGPDEQTRLLVLSRARYRCEVCGGLLQPASIHHRKPRRMGGSRDPLVNDPSNLLAVCGSGTTGCHGWIESRRVEAYQRGLLLYDRDIPWAHPIQDGNGRWWTLDTLGGKVRRVPPINPG